MARQSYGADQNIHSMTTRQLRQYIADKSQEAQERLNTSDMGEASRAFKDAADEITNRAGTKVRRSTSNMSKSEMREFAYALRQFNSLDQTSGFAKSIEWKENKKKYEKFVNNMIDNGTKEQKDMWKQYKTDKGNISKKGYAEYRKYINFLESIKDIREQFGYGSVKHYFVQNESKDNAEKRRKYMEKLMFDIYNEYVVNSKVSITQGELNKLFSMKMAEYDERQDNNEAAQRANKNAPKAIKKAAKTGAKAVKKTAGAIKANPTKQSSGAKVPIKKARKLKEYGRVRR